MPSSSELRIGAATAVAVAAAGFVGLLGCSGPPQLSGSRVVIPTSVGEGHNDAKKARPAAPKTAAAGPAASSAAAPAPPSSAAPDATRDATPEDHGGLPDPAPLSTAHQFDLTVRYAKGSMSLVAATPVELPRPVLTPRRMGRFAVELWIGKELVDRVRFDFPLLAADPPVNHGRRPIRGEPPRFSPGADTSCHVQVPASDRATSARLVDRLTGSTVTIPWPPEPAAGAKAPP